MRLKVVTLSAFYMVSIHASVKDATWRCEKTPTPWCFNPRICKRCDEINVFVNIINLSFNPRICKRCDRVWLETEFQNWVSIHASVKDATKIAVYLRLVNLFQSTHL